MEKDKARRGKRGAIFKGRNPVPCSHLLPLSPPCPSFPYLPGPSHVFCFDVCFSPRSQSQLCLSLHVLCFILTVLQPLFSFAYPYAIIFIFSPAVFPVCFHFLHHPMWISCESFPLFIVRLYVCLVSCSMFPMSKVYL